MKISQLVASVLVGVTPLQEESGPRGRETCELAGVGEHAIIDSGVVEWDHGEFEGLTPRQIHEKVPDWLIFRDGCPSGETPDEVAARADRVTTRARTAEGNVVLFADGHVLRVLVARWIELPPRGGQHFLLDTGT